MAGGIFFFSAKLLSATFMGGETCGFPASLKKSWTFLLDNSAHLDEDVRISFLQRAPGSQLGRGVSASVPARLSPG